MKFRRVLPQGHWRQPVVHLISVLMKTKPKKHLRQGDTASSMGWTQHKCCQRRRLWSQSNRYLHLTIKPMSYASRTVRTCLTLTPDRRLGGYERHQGCESSKRGGELQHCCGVREGLVNTTVVEQIILGQLKALITEGLVFLWE
jgi:hypothetical protein